MANRPGRPTLPLAAHRVKASVSVDPEVYDAIYWVAQQRGESVFAVMSRVLDRVFGNEKMMARWKACYPPPGSSTLSDLVVLRGSAPSSTPRAAAPSRPR